MSNPTIARRQRQIASAFLDQLRRNPNIESSCQKVSIGRATIYRWLQRDKRFARQVEQALIEGRELMSDIAESQLFALIGERKIEAIRLYLAHNNPRYSNKIEISGSVTTKDEPLTKEQRAVIRRALKLSKPRSYDRP